MENEYKTKDMKPEVKVNTPKVNEDGKVYEEKGIWYFKLAGQLYQYKTKEKAEEGLKSLNG
tara:strand:+ start:123 stop:305 length:183 start_codon:yes stop_codon:yes gene_type:complete